MMNTRAILTTPYKNGTNFNNVLPPIKRTLQRRIEKFYAVGYVLYREELYREGVLVPNPPRIIDIFYQEQL